jgi:hypothetical protein
VLVYYTIGDAVLADSDAVVTLEFLDADGEVVRTVRPQVEGYDEMNDDDKGFHGDPWIVLKDGVCRFVWDLRHEGSTKVLGNKLAGEANLGPLAVPGTYEARLSVTTSSGDSEVQNQSFEVVNDPRVKVSQEDLKAQLAALLEIREKISEAHEGVTALRSVRGQLQNWTERSDLDEQSATSAKALIAQLDAIEGELIVPGEHTDTFGLNERSRLNENLASVISVIASADTKPTTQSLGVASKYSDQIDEQLGLLKSVLDVDIAEFNTLMRDSDLPAVE